MNLQKTYPRVLIVGESFANITGGGITLSNLFKGWPKERLAVVNDLRFYPNTAVCNQYYRLGSSEWRFKWPVSLLLKNGRKSGAVIIDEYADEPDISKEKNDRWQKETGILDRKNFIKEFLSSIDDAVGSEAVIRNLKLSTGLAEWIKDFQPDLIYTQLSTIQLISLTDQLSKTFQVPYVIHIMDDWPSTLYSDKLLAAYLRHRLEKEFNALLSHASGFFGISQKMCAFYEKKYSRSCIPFHNPLDLDRWLEASKKNWNANTPFRIMYRGHLGMGIERSLIDLCDAVYELYQSGRAVRLEITLTPTCNEQTKQVFERPGCVNVKEIIPYGEIPTALAGADLLVLAYDFDSEAVNINRYSMPTRATEFMVSGTPVLVYGPGELAVTEYARDEKWAEIVTDCDKKRLVLALTRLMDDQDLRKKLGCRAKELAVDKHDAVHVREAFRKALVCATTQSSVTVNIA